MARQAITIEDLFERLVGVPRKKKRKVALVKELDNILKEVYLREIQKEMLREKERQARLLELLEGR